MCIELVDYYSKVSFGEVYRGIYRRKRFMATHDRMSDNIPPQMNILNMVNKSHYPNKALYRNCPNSATLLNKMAARAIIDFYHINIILNRWSNNKIFHPNVPYNALSVSAKHV